MEFILTDEQVSKLKEAISRESEYRMSAVTVEDVTENDIAEYLDVLIDNL